MRVFESWEASRPSSEEARRLDPLALAEEPREGPFVLLHGEGPGTRYAILGEEPLGRLLAPDLAGLDFLRSGPRPALAPDLIGQATYEWGVARERLVEPALPSPLALPAFSFVLYGSLSVLDRRTGLLHRARRRLEGAPPPDFVPDEGRPSVLAGRGGRTFSTRPLGGSEDEAGYRSKVGAIRELITAGEVYQVNLTRQEEWAYEGDLRHLAAALAGINPAPFSAFVAEPDFALISTSPERLARLEGGLLETRPIKGTAPRSREAAEDRALAAGLLASEKDRAELAMIVDLERDDLARVCLPGTVEVGAYPLLESYANVHHLVASVRGRLDPSRRLEELLGALLPGGSITGCPKIAAMKAIRALEGLPRSIYTGALGWLAADLSALDLNIAIRTIWSDGDRLRFGVGGAVVWDSDPAAEYLETLHKARSIVACLNSARA